MRNLKVINSLIKIPFALASLTKSDVAMTFYNTLNSKKFLDMKSPKNKAEPKLDTEKKEKKEPKEKKEKKEKKLQLSSQKVVN